jgi:hypothetical protein
MSVEASSRPAVTMPRLSARTVEGLGWLTLAALLVLLVPLFLCMPLTIDAAFYDVAGRHILRGGAPERDFVFLTPPGMAGSLAAIRAVLGKSSIAVRATDLVIVTAIIVLLARWVRSTGSSRAAAVWCAVVLFAFYLSMSEWCQTQPDTWMLLPALLALHLRRKQVETPASAKRSWIFGRATLEGVCWGAACLFKPFVVVPGVFCWLVSVLMLRRATPNWRTRVALNAAGLVAGGLFVAALWQGWLVAHGSWQTYWHNVADYRDFYSSSAGWEERVRRAFLLLTPWSLLHGPALVAAVVVLAAVAVGRSSWRTPGLLAAFYLGLWVQANFLQSQFNYHLVPPLLLGLAFLAVCLDRLAVRRVAWPLYLGCVAFAFFDGPAVQPTRLALWPRCWLEGSSPEMRNRLELDAEHFSRADWVALERTADYLRGQAVGDQELICYSASTTHLLIALEVRPASRFLYPSVFCKGSLAGHREANQAEMRASGVRFLVTDLQEYANLSPRQAAAEVPGQPLALPPALPADRRGRYPLSEPVVFRAGRYYVHAATGAARPADAPHPAQ